MGVARAVASWQFACAVLGFIAVWVGWNVAARPFEPYPVIVFAVISAVLATVAALQGPSCCSRSVVPRAVIALAMLKLCGLR